jgi:hypothetical protein
MLRRRQDNERAMNGPPRQAWARHRSLRSDQGATAVDYLGVIVVVGAITTAISATSLGQNIYHGIQHQICRITGGNCAGPGPGQQPKTDADYQPTQCNTSTVEDKAGDQVKIAWFTFGNEYGFQQQDYVTPDGKHKVYLTFTDAAALGATWSPKPGAKIGKLGVDTVDLGAGIKVTDGDTWVFDSPQQAANFRQELEDLKMWQEAMQYGGVDGIPNPYVSYKYMDLKEKVDKQLGTRHIGFGKIGLNLSGDLAFKESPLEAEGLGLQFGGKFSANPEVTITRNDAADPPTTDYTYQFQMDYSGSAKITAAQLSAKGELGQTRTGTITVSRYRDGSLASLEMTQTVTGNNNRTVDGEGSKEDGKGKTQGTVTGSASQNDQPTTIITNTLNFPPGTSDPQVNANRQIAESWLKGNGDKTAPFQYLFGDKAPTTRPGADDPFGQLMFDQGVSSKTQYNGVTDAQEYGFEVNLDMSLGAGVSFEKSQQHIAKAQFLGAPQPNGTRSYLPYSYCAR